MHFMWICRVLPYLEKNDSTGRVVDKLAARCRCRRMWLADGRGRFVCHQRPRRWGCCGNAVASAVGAERWTGDGALSPVAESTFNGRFSSCCAVQCRASVTSRVPLCVCVCVCARAPFACRIRKQQWRARKVSTANWTPTAAWVCWPFSKPSTHPSTKRGRGPFCIRRPSAPNCSSPAIRSLSVVSLSAKRRTCWFTETASSIRARSAPTPPPPVSCIPMRVDFVCRGHSAPLALASVLFRIPRASIYLALPWSWPMFWSCTWLLVESFWSAIRFHLIVRRA